MVDYLVPLLLALCCILALHRQENAYDLLISGSKDGLKLLLSIVPTMVILMTAVTMLRASGAVTWISRFLAPVMDLLGIPPETALLVLIRPISGSAALAVGAELMASHGVDSLNVAAASAVALWQLGKHSG